MTKRRDHGDGSIHPRKDGRIAGSFYVRGKDGKRKREYVYGRTKTEAKEKLRAAKRAYEDGKLKAEKQSQSLESWLTFWLATQQATGTLRPSTLYSYRRAIARHILPKLGALALNALVPETIQSWVNELAGTYKPKTVSRIYGTLSSALRLAVELKKIPFNPCAGIAKPRIKKYHGPVLSAQQARLLVEAAKESPLQCLLTVAIATGMRQGELRSLTWDEINLEKGVLQVKKTVAYLPDEMGKHRYVEGDPKSEAGVRSISLPAFAVEALRAHRVRQNEQRLARGPRWQDKGLVFTTEDGNYYNLASLHHQFKQILEVAGLPVNMRFHDLRHSSATILFVMKVNPKTVQKRLGHSDIKTTLGLYGQVTPEMEENTMQDFDAKWKEQG
jgi:integrase